MNDIAFHPVHGTLATVGSDGRFNFWDKDVRTKLKTSDQINQPITACSFDSTGKIFAYACSYDWSQVCVYILKYYRECNNGSLLVVVLGVMIPQIFILIKSYSMILILDYCYILNYSY